MEQTLQKVMLKKDTASNIALVKPACSTQWKCTGYSLL